MPAGLLKRSRTAPRDARITSDKIAAAQGKNDMARRQPLCQQGLLRARRSDEQDALWWQCSHDLPLRVLEKIDAISCARIGFFMAGDVIKSDSGLFATRRALLLPKPQDDRPRFLAPAYE
jgi:hypothetical protein